MELTTYKEGVLKGDAMRLKPVYGLMIQPLQRILRDLTFTDRKEASARARDENRCGDYKGRGVKVVRIN